MLRSLRCSSCTDESAGIPVVAQTNLLLQRKMLLLVCFVCSSYMRSMQVSIC